MEAALVKRGSPYLCSLLMKENKKVYAKVIPPPDSKAVRYQDDTSRTEERLLLYYDRRHRFVATSDQIAESLHYQINWKWPESDKFFPNDPDMRLVDKYYPYAKGGPLLVDEPRGKEAVDKAYKKQKVLKAQGLRHLVIEEQAVFIDLLEQIGAL